MVQLAVVWLTFAAAFLVVIAVSSVASRAARVRRRLKTGDAAVQYAAGAVGSASLGEFLRKNFDERFFRKDESARLKLRKELMRAGHFGANAASIYLLVRVVLLGLPVLGLLYSSAVLPAGVGGMQVILVATLAFIAAYGPKAYLSRRQGRIQTQCRCAFPDMMDLLVVCVDAGLSLEASVARIGSEISVSSRALAINLALTNSEIRAGGSTIEALQHFADRVGIEQATSLVTLLRQSAELGASISQALKVYAEEMRDQRMSRAEERAHALPAKLVLPLGLFIFPVMLTVALYPIMLKIMEGFASVRSGL